MVDVDDFIDEFLEHAGQSKEERAAYNREYYLRNRKLKTRMVKGPVIKGPSRKEQARVKAIQDKLVRAKKAAEKAPPNKKKGLLDKIRNIEKQIESSKAGKLYKSLEKGYDQDLRDAPGVTKNFLTNPSKANARKIYDNFDLGQPKHIRYKDRQKLIQQEERLANARKSAARLPKDKRNAVEKKIDAAEKKLNKLKKKIKNPFSKKKVDRSRPVVRNS